MCSIGSPERRSISSRCLRSWYSLLLTSDCSPLRKCLASCQWRNDLSNQSRDKENRWPWRTNHGLPQQEVHIQTELGLIEIWKKVVASRQDIKTCEPTLENEANLINRKTKIHPHCSNFTAMTMHHKEHPFKKIYLSCLRLVCHVYCLVFLYFFDNKPVACLEQM